MAELSSVEARQQPFFPLQSRDGYFLHIDQVFDELNDVVDPSTVDAHANDLIFLALKHPFLNEKDRLEAITDISSNAMLCLRKFSIECNGSIITTQAQMIHSAFAQVYALSIIELAKSLPATS